MNEWSKIYQLSGHPRFRLLSLPSGTLFLFLVLTVPVDIFDPAVEEVVGIVLVQLVGAVLEEHVEPGTGLLVLDIL